MIKITRIDGDAAVTRHTAIGGDASVEGSATIGHNLTVNGHIDAHSIRGCDRGLYTSEQALLQAWPNPEPGWWALVGTTLPAKIYSVNSSGRWAATGGTAGEITVDGGATGPQVEALKQQIEQMQTALTEAQNSANEALEKAHDPSVVRFANVVQQATLSGGKSPLLSTSPGVAILYVEEFSTFVLNTLDTSALIPKAVNYFDWADRHLFTDSNTKPYYDKIYVCTATDAAYIVSGQKLLQI